MTQLDLFIPEPHHIAIDGTPIWYDRDRLVFRTDPPPWGEYPAVMEARP